MIKTGLLISLLFISLSGGFECSIPINAPIGSSTSLLKLTEIGEFGLMRKERPGVPAHFHTGIDIKRPSNNYQSEPIFPIANGIVISKRVDGPYAQLIIEHEGEQRFWTVYEHIAGIEVNLFDRVKHDQPIARFMNRNELNRYGWQFDHFHFEILKVEPMRLKQEQSKPERLFASYTLACYTKEDLDKYFYHPLDFLSHYLN
ncbi:M23 family metallopeptidase [Carboxylicivirga marina]|uniref:M23 family metallopeptidase n=1 Tax=Carboxylicivirga marina TaxID=2800988 RepID=UPI002592C533|nr:M23 family metallopeptidase [uncultured Carboxylicivirga sp.]